MKFSERQSKVLKICGILFLGALFVMGATFQTIWVGKFYGDGANLTNVTSTSISTNTAALIATNDPFNRPLSNKVAVVVTVNGGGLSATTNNGLLTLVEDLITATNNDTVVSNALWSLLNAATNTAYGYTRARTSDGTNNTISATNDLLATLTYTWVTNLINHRVGTNVLAQSFFDYLATLVAGGSQTPWASDINAAGHSLSNLLSIIGNDSTSSNIFMATYGSLVAFQVKTNGQIVIAGPISGLFSTAGTNANGSGLAFLEDVLNATNGLSGVLKTYTQNATNDLLAALTYTWVTNLINHRVGTNVFAQSAFDYFATLGGGSGTLGNTNTTAYINATGGWSWLLTNTLAELMRIGQSTIYTETNTLHNGSAGARFQLISQTGDTNGFFTLVNAANYNLLTNADNTAKFQLAVDTSTNYGGIVFIPHGTWPLNGQLNLWPGIQLWGEAPSGGTGGSGTVLYSAGNNTTNVVSYGKNTIWGITFQGDGRDKGTGIRSVPDTSNVSQNNTIRQCNFVSISNGIVLNYSWDWKIENCLGVNNTHGVLMSNQCNDIQFRGNHWTGNYFGVKSLGLNYQQTFNDTFEQSSNGLFFAGGVPGAPRGIQINAYGENCTNVIVANGVASLQILGGQMVSCPNGTNIILVGCDHPQIIGTHFNDALPAVDVDSTSTGLRWEPGMINMGAAFSLRAANRMDYSGTNFAVVQGTAMVIISNGNLYASSNLMAGTRFISPTNASVVGSVPVGNSTGGDTLWSNTVPYSVISTQANFVTVATLTNVVYQTNVLQTILTPATATNTMPLFGGFFRLVISTPAAITNLTGVTAGVYAYATCVFSNSLATTLTNRMLINAIASGYDATNSVAALGLNGFVVGAGKQVRLLVDAEGINQTNWMLIRQ